MDHFEREPMAPGDAGVSAKRAPLRPLSQAGSSPNYAVNRRPSKKTRYTTATGSPKRRTAGGRDDADSSEGREPSWDPGGERDSDADPFFRDPLRSASFQIWIGPELYSDAGFDAQMDEGDGRGLTEQPFYSLLAERGRWGGLRRDPSEYRLQEVYDAINRMTGMACNMFTHYLVIGAPTGYTQGALPLDFPIEIRNETAFTRFVGLVMENGTVVDLIQGPSPNCLNIVLLKAEDPRQRAPKRKMADLLAPGLLPGIEESAPPVLLPEGPTPVAPREPEAERFDRAGPDPRPAQPPAGQPRRQGRGSKTPPAETGSVPNGTPQRPISIQSSPAQEAGNDESAPPRHDEEGEEEIALEDDADLPNQEPQESSAVGRAKKSQILNSVLRTPDDGEYWRKTAEFFGLPLDKTSYSDSFQLLGTKLPSRPQQYVDVWLMLERLADPTIERADGQREHTQGCIVGHETGFGKTRVGLLFLAALRLIQLSAQDVKTNPDGHMGMIQHGPLQTVSLRVCLDLINPK
ncbi:hypothetical protein LX36DRAFT_673710 [Colletotrichum falcatum]|nr:hypothetical protein LX36DRAFT_673710 [Colletotrichum falcatum]